MSFTALELNGKVAVIIGGTSGIGRAIAHGMAEAGAEVVPSSRRAESVNAAAKEIEERGRRTVRITSDVGDRASLEQLRDQTIAELGKVDILVNCAGRTKRAPTIDFPEGDWNAIIETNLTGTLRACQVFGKHMLERKFGRIINIASLSTFVGWYEVAAYSASKAAVASLTKSLALEWSPHGVNVNAIAPGVFETDLNRHLLRDIPRGNDVQMRTPKQRFGAVEQLAGAAVYPACDPDSVVVRVEHGVDRRLHPARVNQQHAEHHDLRALRGGHDRFATRDVLCGPLLNLPRPLP